MTDTPAFRLADMTTPKRRRWPLFAVLAAVVVAALVAGFLLWPEPTTPAAVVACRDEVKKQLKAPASAQFSEETVTADAEVQVVKGLVDAQNGAGALIRNRYSCRARPVGNGWSLGNVELADW